MIRYARRFRPAGPPPGQRDAAVVLLFLDTGIRCAELSALDLADCDLPRGRLLIRHGKGNKQRVVPFARRCRAALEAYLAVRGPTPGPLVWAVTGPGQLRPGVRLVEFPRVTAFAEIVKTQGALAVASSPRGRPGRCGGRARGRGACGGDPRRENHVRRDGADRRGGSVVSSRSIAVRAGHRHLLVAPRTRLRDAPRALNLDGATSLTPPELSTSRSSTSAARAVLVASSLWRPLG